MELHALALRDWDPEFVIRRITDWEREHPLIKACLIELTGRMTAS